MTSQFNVYGRSGLICKRAALRIIAASALALSLAGCAHRHDYEHAESFVGPEPTYAERHPIEIVKGSATLALQVPGNAGGLNVYQKDRVRHFIADWRTGGSGKITVAGNNRAALSDVRDLLIERVVPVASVQVIGYRGHQPGVNISFARSVAVPPKCGIWNSNLAEDSKNTEHSNFGCAGQHDLAVLVANPKDLVTPRDQVDWSDADRNDFMHRAFNVGKGTGGDTTQTDKAGTISTVGNH